MKSRIAVILTLPIEYNTSSNIRSKAIIKGLYENGNEVICYCPKADTKHKYYGQNDLDLYKIEVIRYKKNYIRTNMEGNIAGNSKSIKSVVKQMLLHIYRKVDFFGSSIRYVSEKKWISKDIQRRECDVLLSFSDPKPAHIIGGYCKRHNSIKYIQQWGDPLTNDITNRSILPMWVKKYVEKRLIKHADKICYVSPLTLQSQRCLFPAFADRMTFIPTPSLNYKDQVTISEHISFGYFGSYASSVRDIMPLYNAAKKHSKVDFYIIGDSDIVLDSMENIHVITGRVAPNVVAEYMTKVNVIVCLMNKKGGQIPGKVYHDASSKKDILLIKDGEYADEIQNFFEKYGHYTFVENNVEAIDIAIDNYVVNGVPVRKPVEEFKAVNVAKKLIEG